MEREKKFNKGLVATLVIIALVLVLTWAVSTFFALTIAKALSAVVLGLFIVIIALFMSGFGF